MKKSLIIVFVFSGFAAVAQIDTGKNGGIAIPRVENNTYIAPSTTTVSPDSPFSNIKPDKQSVNHYPSFSIGEKKPDFSMDVSDGFADRTQEFSKRTKVKPKGDSAAPYKGNKDFGELHTKSDYLDILAADYGAEDGDIVRILINGEVVIHEFTLSNMAKPLRVHLQPGFNNIEFEAMNQGTSGPNTANFAIYDQQRNQLMNDEWALATGFKGKVMVIKDAD